MSRAATLYDLLEARLWENLVAGAHPWRVGADLTAKRLGLEADVALDGVVEAKALFARVVQEQDPRRFRPAEAAERATATPALILPVEDNDDLVAFSLKPESKRIWRLTCDCTWLGDERPVDPRGTLRLRQEPHEWLRAHLRAQAYTRRARDERRQAAEDGFALARQRSGVPSFAAAKALPEDDEGRLAYLRGFGEALRNADAVEARFAMLKRLPPGALVLDPVGIDWTRAGGLDGVEAIEILDAPADGPLGRALTRINPRIGTKRGVALIGLEPAKPKRRAA